VPRGLPFHDLAVTDGMARATVPTEQAHRLCEGHFPGEPIVPGAFLAGLMADVAAALFPGGARLVEVERAVFLARVTPDVPIAVTARREDATHAAAEVHAGAACAARARLRFSA
jgi:3-hydroxymyristoyl/3-hydroxydecanoyl-(acyl carrier protein) dehydratase